MRLIMVPVTFQTWSLFYVTIVPDDLLWSIPSSRHFCWNRNRWNEQLHLKEDHEQKCVGLYLGLRLVDVLLKELDGEKDLVIVLLDKK